jgi:hypothetical protein
MAAAAAARLRERRERTLREDGEREESFVCFARAAVVVV